MTNPAVGDIQVTLSVDHSTLTLVNTGGLSVNGNGTDKVVIKGTLDAINTALAKGLTYTPTANWNGDAVITVKTNDLGLYGSSMD